MTNHSNTNAAPRVVGLPGLYVQGDDILHTLASRLIEGFRCSRVCVIFDPVVETALSALWAAPSQALRWTPLRFGGSCTRHEIERLCALATADAPQVIVGAGGGQAMDTAKAVARQLQVPLVIVPTAASSDAPTSRLIAIYDERHTIVDVPHLPWNPSMVFVDTAILAKAPRRLFVAGIGDAFTKRFEVADATRDPRQANYFGGRPPHLAAVLGRECHSVLIEHAASALHELDTGAPGPAFQRVVEATILYSGLAFESGGLSVAHGMLRGLTAFEETQTSLHGELVSYGLLVQLHAFDYAPMQIEEVARFLCSMGLPTSLRQMGLPHASMADMTRIAELTLAAPYLAHLDPPLTTTWLANAMLKVERATDNTMNHPRQAT